GRRSDHRQRRRPAGPEGAADGVRRRSAGAPQRERRREHRMSRMEAMRRIKNLHAKVRDTGKEIRRGIDLEVGAGEVHAIMGPNGSGKSTLAQVLAGRETFEVTKGEVLYEGSNLLGLAPHERRVAGRF